MTPPLLLAAGILRKYSRGSLLFRQGAKAETAFLLVSGEVAVVTSGRDGSETEVARFGKGDWIGEAVVLAAAPYPSSARACADIEALAYSAQALERAASSDADSAAYLLRLLSLKCVALNRRLYELSAMPARERLIAYLVSLPPVYGGEAPSKAPYRVRLGRKKGDIAALLGIAPETLSRAIHALEADGLIAIKASRVDILDRSALLAESSAGA
jgi:CRP-like cAMP-binding protein